MTALYQGTVVRVVRVQGRHSLIVWQGKLKRVQARELVMPGDGGWGMGVGGSEAQS